MFADDECFCRTQGHDCNQGRGCPRMRAKPESAPPPVGSQLGPVERFFLLLGIALAAAVIGGFLQ